VTADYDVIVLCTNHREYADIDFRALGVPLIDCRNAARLRPDRYYPA
jgi:UDP-N-acetyl-D-mannosaminuronate dehydrogenase